MTGGRPDSVPPGGARGGALGSDGRSSDEIPPDIRAAAHHTALRRALRLIGIGLLLMTGYKGTVNGVQNLRHAGEGLRLAADLAVLGYGLTGIAATAAVVLFRRLGGVLAVTWAVLISAAAVVAPLAYAPGRVPPSAAVGSGVVSAILAAAVVWAVWPPRRRRAPGASSGHAG